MRTFVTGGSGFLGSAVVRALRDRDHEVVAVVRPSSDRRLLDELPGVEVVVAELTDRAALREHMRGCEGMCHVAGAAGRFYRARDEYRRSNELVSEVVFAAAREAGIGRAVYTGTVAMVVGLDNAYAHSKLAGAYAARREAGSDMEVVAVHPSGMIGPRDAKPTPLGRAIALFAAGGQRAVVGGGSGYLHVDDAGLAHAIALERGEPTRDYLLDAEYWSTRALFGRLAEVVGRPAPWVIPIGVASGLASVVEPAWRALGRLPPITTFTTSYLGLSREVFVGGDEARRALALPAYRTVESALDDALRWFRDAGLDRAALAR
mgnify:CR=1 FL=1